MPVSTISSLNRTLQETQEWLDDLAAKEPIASEEQAYSVLRAVLHAVRDRLTVEEAVHLSAQLPMLVRGFYFEGWRPGLAPNDEKTADEFLGAVRESLRNAAGNVDVAEATRAVLQLLDERVTEGQMRHVRDQLPREIQDFLRG